MGYQIYDLNLAEHRVIICRLWEDFEERKIREYDAALVFLDWCLSKEKDAIPKLTITYNKTGTLIFDLVYKDEDGMMAVRDFIEKDIYYAKTMVNKLKELDTSLSIDDDEIKIVSVANSNLSNITTNNNYWVNADKTTGAVSLDLKIENKKVKIDTNSGMLYVDLPEEKEEKRGNNMFDFGTLNSKDYRLSPYGLAVRNSVNKWGEL